MGKFTEYFRIGLLSNEAVHCAVVEIPAVYRGMLRLLSQVSQNLKVVGPSGSSPAQEGTPTSSLPRIMSRRLLEISRDVDLSNLFQCLPGAQERRQKMRWTFPTCSIATLPLAGGCGRSTCPACEKEPRRSVLGVCKSANLPVLLFPLGCHRIAVT